MNLNLFKGKGLFVFSDPGGAKALLALSELLCDNSSDVIIISDRYYDFYSNFTLSVLTNLNSPHENFNIHKPDYVFTGTSYSSKIELEYIKISKSKSIPVYSFIDHWTSIRDRFNNNNNEIFPDKILVIDERAKQIAESDGINKNSILVFGNPYYVYLENWEPIISRQDFMAAIGLGYCKKKIVLFAPEPLSNVNGVKQFGFDEIQSTVLIQKILENFLDEYQFLLTPHPNQNLSALKEVLNNKIYLLPKGIDVNNMIYFSDLIIGHFSNLLIEASILGKKVIRFLPNNSSYDPLNSEIGIIVNQETLHQNFSNLI